MCGGGFEFEQNYFTFCEKTFTESISENENSNLVLTVLVLSFLLLGILASVLFLHRKKIFARFHHPLVQDDVDRNFDHFGFI